MINVFEKHFPKDLYHSYVIEGHLDYTTTELLNYFEINKNYNIFYQKYEAFTIENSREIKLWHSQYAINDNKKICIISTKFINPEAEQALLKIIEEPTQNTHFFIIIPDINLIKDTIISRVHLIKADKYIGKEHNEFVNNFMDLSIKERLEKISLIMKEYKDEENSAKLRDYSISFINKLENIFYLKLKEDKKNKKIISILGEFQKSRSYLSKPGSSVKMILEHLALMI
jgi:hypothetical protein